MKRLILFLWILSLPGVISARAQSAEQFGATTKTVGWQTNGFETPDNQFLTPAGRLVGLPGVRPNALALSPDGKALATSGMQPELIIVDAATGSIRQRVPFPSDQQLPALDSVSKVVPVLNLNPKDKLSFTGIVFSPDGARIYLSNVSGDIKVFGVGKDSRVSALFSIPLPRANLPDREMDIPAGLALSPDGKESMWPSTSSNRVLELDTTTGKLRRLGRGFGAVRRCALAGKKIYVSNWGGRRPGPNSAVGAIGRNGTVRVDERGPSPAKAPFRSLISSLARHHKVRAWKSSPAFTPARWRFRPTGDIWSCANAGEDTISVIDTRADRIVETLCARQNPGDLFGAQPDALAFDRRGKKLYVCNGSQNAVAVFAIQARAIRKLLGLIPVGWFPGAIAYDTRHRTSTWPIYHFPSRKERRTRRRATAWASTASNGSARFPWCPFHRRANWTDYSDRAGQFTLPAAGASQIASARPSARRNPCPSAPASRASLITSFTSSRKTAPTTKCSAMSPEGDGDPDLCVFGQRVTPNQHKFVHDFVLLDNTYCSGIMSADGHQWTDSAIATDYIERSFAGWPRSYPGGGGELNGRDALAYSSAGFIWNDALAHGKTRARFRRVHHGASCLESERASAQAGWLDRIAISSAGSNAIGYYAEAGPATCALTSMTNYSGSICTCPMCFARRNSSRT